jgi:fluoride exporter
VPAFHPVPGAYHRAVVRTLAVVAAGGVLGALCRYGLGVVVPAAPGHYPWTTFWVNVSGCALIGVLVVLVTEGWPGTHPLLRPFLGTGFLGGYTTFSTYVVDVTRLADGGALGTAAVYLFGTLAGALLATYAGVLGARLLIRFSLTRRSA